MYPENSHEYACIQCGYHSYSKDNKKMNAEAQPVNNPAPVTSGDFASQPGSL